MHKINTAAITADQWNSVWSGEKQFKLSDNLSEQRESVKVFLGNDVFVNLRTVSVSENLYLFLAIVADIVHSKPKHTCMTRIKLVIALHKMYILIFAFRGCYYLAHLYCKICFKSQSILQNFPWTSFLHDVLWCRIRSDFNCLQTVGRFLSRVSDYLSSYVFLLRRRSFATRKVYISLETRITFFCRYLIELMFLELDV